MRLLVSIFLVEGHFSFCVWGFRGCGGRGEGEG